MPCKAALGHDPFPVDHQKYMAMNGGAGADLFYVSSYWQRSQPTYHDEALVIDFNPAEGDRVDIWYYHFEDVDEATGGQTHYVGAEVFAALDTDANGVLNDNDNNVWYDEQHDQLEINYGGDAITGFEDLIKLGGVDHLSADWLV
jgi:hypothetical protein